VAGRAEMAKPKTRATRPVSSARRLRGRGSPSPAAGLAENHARSRKARRRPRCRGGSREETAARARRRAPAASPGASLRAATPRACARARGARERPPHRHDDDGQALRAQPTTMSQCGRCRSVSSRSPATLSSSSDASRCGVFWRNAKRLAERVLIEAGAHRAVTERRATPGRARRGARTSRDGARRASDGRARRARARGRNRRSRRRTHREQRQREEPGRGPPRAWAAVLAPAQQLGQRQRPEGERDQAPPRLASQPSGERVRRREREDERRHEREAGERTRVKSARAASTAPPTAKEWRCSSSGRLPRRPVIAQSITLEKRPEEADDEPRMRSPGRIPCSGALARSESGRSRKDRKGLRGAGKSAVDHRRVEVIVEQERDGRDGDR